MGCISSKLLATGDEIFFYHDFNSPAVDCPNHVVSLTSTTYGLLNLDPAITQQAKPKSEAEPEPEPKLEDKEAIIPAKECCVKSRSTQPAPTLVLPQFKKKGSLVCDDKPSEVINAWELMQDLADETPFWSPMKRMPSQPHLMHLSPSVIVAASPKKQKKRLFGKENCSGGSTPASKRGELSGSQHRVLRPFSSLDNAQWLGLTPNVVSKKGTPKSAGGAGVKSGERDCGFLSSSRRSLGPFFDPQLLATLEKEHSEQGEQIKKMVMMSNAAQQTGRKSQNSGFLLLQGYEERCPPGGENAVVLYTTTLRGIRKTFEDCNAVRAAIECYDVQVVEKDISMDSGYREELRLLMGKKDVKVPVVFVKGRMIGGKDEVLRLEEEGKLGVLLEGIPRAMQWCEGCGGLRFVMCMSCNGSCKVLDEEQKKTVKCADCNENGLIHCPLCC